MKKMLLTLLSVLVAVSSFAQEKSRQAPPKFRTIVFCDTNDEKIGVGEQKNLLHFTDLCSQIAAGIDLMEVAESFVGNKCSKDYLMKWLKSFKCNSEDLVLFYYMGHGTRSVQDTSMFPQMCLGSNYDEDFVSLEYVKNAIMEKGPRFALIMADCCNNVGMYVTPKNPVLGASGNTVMDGIVESENLKRLFLEQSGCVIASGSRAGEYSWINTDPTDTKRAGFFTDAFIEELTEYTKAQRSSCSWDELMRNVQGNVGSINIQDRKGNIWKQHPVYRVETSKRDPIPDIDIPDLPTLKNELERIADDRNDPYERVKGVAEIEKTYFAKDAMVKIVGRDHATVVGFEPAHQYLSRISTASRLRKISILEQKMDRDGKVTQMTVHEFYMAKTPNR